MTKKGFLEKYQTLIAGIAIVGIIYFIAASGMINLSNIFSLVQPAPLAPLQPQTQYYSYNVQVNIQPNPVCVHDDITATITSNIPNGVCSIFIDPGTGFYLLGNVYLDASGNFTTTETMGTIGTAVIRTICCDATGNCRIANDITLVVTNAIPPCPPGPAPPPGPDSDGDGYTDEEEEAADTNPFDPNDYPGSNGGAPNGYTCGIYTSCQGTCPTGYFCAQIESEANAWCACITGGNGDPGTVHPDWKPGGTYYNPWQI